MDEEFKAKIADAAKEFLKLDRSKTVRIVSHLDSDGITSISILIKVLTRLDIRYSLSIIQQLDKNFLYELKSEEYDTFIFCDLGSGSLSDISTMLSGKRVFILDHHELKDVKADDNIIHINPHLFGIDGGKEISGSGVMFFFARAIDKDNDDLAHLAIIGAIGDVQENKGFIGLNKEILAIAEQKNKISVEKGLRLFGIKSRPVHKLLEYCNDPFIPGVSGSESGVIQFLNELNIDPKKGNAWKLYADLTVEERSRIITGIILKRAMEKNPEDIFGFHYHIHGEDFDILQDAKEFSTLLNACGRLSKASLGIGACIGDNNIKKKAIANLNEYKKEIVSAINWYNDNIDTPYVIKDDGYIIINAQDNILHTIIGTLSSILSKSNEIEEGTYILGLAHTLDNKIKISLRMAGTSFMDESADLRLLLSDMIKKTGGETGGHAMAAGAVIDFDKEDLFIDAAKEILSQQAKKTVEY